MSEAEVARDLHSLLAQVNEGMEIIIEQEKRPAAVLKASKPVGRMISETVADLKGRESEATMDDDFALDVERGIESQKQPWNPPPCDQ